MTALFRPTVAVELTLHAAAERIADRRILPAVLILFTGVRRVREWLGFSWFTAAGPHCAHDHHNSKQ